MNKVAQTLIVAAMVAVSSCSVKEDRTPCPSYITVDASSFREYSDTAYAHLLDDSQDLRHPLDLKSGELSHEWLARKGKVITYVFSNLMNSVEREGVVLVPVGQQADPLRAFSRQFECYEELVTIQAKADRQSTLVHLQFKNVNEEVYPYDLEVVGDVCGINLRSMTPVKGEFRHALELDRELSCEFYLPRQLPDSKPVLEIRYGGTRIDSFPLYSWIAASHYDWTRDDLPDVFIEIDQAQLHFSVNVEGWVYEGFYEVIF